MKKKLIAAALFAFAGAALAQATPAGLWKTIDDKTGKERSLIRISEAGGVYTGVIEKSLDPNSDRSAVCDKCTDDRKGKPLIGMALIRGVKQNADDKEVFDGGDITDPDNGKVYRVRLKPIESGKKLEVRGYIGPFFRTQTWLKAD
jgi:uncharacterized protein (DUF2147 family)